MVKFACRASYPRPTRQWNNKGPEANINTHTHTHTHTNLLNIKSRIWRQSINKNLLNLFPVPYEASNLLLKQSEL